MKRLSLSELKKRQQEINERIEQEEQREKIRIGAYIMQYTGLDELSAIQKWLDEHVLLDDEIKEDNENEIQQRNNSADFGKNALAVQ